MTSLSLPHSLPRSPSLLPSNQPRIIAPSFNRFPLFRCSANLRNSKNHQNSRANDRFTATRLPAKLEVERFASISSSSTQETSSIGVNPQISIPPPPSNVGLLLFWISAGIGLSALFSLVATRLKIAGKQWRQKQISRITDKVFDHFKNERERANLNFEDLYIGVLLVYNDINKHLPGPHFDPPSKDTVRAMMKENDLNLDEEIDSEEFAKFIKQLTADTLVVVSQGLILKLVAAPVVAIATKRATEGLPGVGKVVQRLPNSVYASLLTLIVLLFQ
ncbi:hypothetical protein ACFX10_027888 [Malus domestica]